ncbi:MAG TPA: helix-turn-helix transcriptional regulator [Puia sp.]|jgi:DNA-binding CsgD family transcriptional regulator
MRAPNRPESIKEYIRFAKDYQSRYTGNAAELISHYAGFVHPASVVAPTYYLLDYTTGKYVFLSPGIEVLSGFKLSYCMDGGVEFFTGRYEQIDFNVIARHVFRENRQFLKELPVEQHPDFMFSYNLRFRNRKGELASIIQHHSMIQSTPAGTPILSFGYVYPANLLINEKRTFYAISRIRPSVGLSGEQPLIQKCFFHFEEDSLLSQREREVLKWMSDGLSSKQIAARMHVSIHTINNHRKNMLQKTNCNNVAEILKYGLLHRLF